MSLNRVRFLVIFALLACLTPMTAHASFSFTQACVDLNGATYEIQSRECLEDPTCKPIQDLMLCMNGNCKIPETTMLSSTEFIDRMDSLDNSAPAQVLIAKLRSILAPDFAVSDSSVYSYGGLWFICTPQIMADAYESSGLSGRLIQYATGTPPATTTQANTPSK